MSAVGCAASGLLDEPHLSRVGDRLAALVAASNDTITTGFAGTPTSAMR